MERLQNNLLIIFPEDSTTKFLEEIPKFLIKNVKNATVELLIIRPNLKSHEKALKKIAATECKNILYLGHGTHTNLFGARNRGYAEGGFITKNNFDVFNNKNIILLSCNSADFIRSIKPQILSIGFGDLPTDYNDITGARELDVRAYKGFTDEVISLFKKELISIVNNSITEYLNNKLTFPELYLSMRLHINKRIVGYLKDKPFKDYLILTQQLHTTKNELYHK